MKLPHQRFNINFTIPEPITEQNISDWIKINLLNEKLPCNIKNIKLNNNFKIIEKNNKIKFQKKIDTENSQKIEVLYPENLSLSEIIPIKQPISLSIYAPIEPCNIIKLLNCVLYPVIKDMALVKRLSIKQSVKITGVWICINSVN